MMKIFRFRKMVSNSSGQVAEGLAQRHLERQGLSIITKNYSRKVGEIDLIMQDQDVIVFVEVRYREHKSMLDILESVNIHKQRKLRKTALSYIQSHTSDQPCRFDVVGIAGSLANPRIEWVKNAF